MIARVWRGWTRSWDADAYARYLMATTIPQCRAAPGNRAACLAGALDRGEPWGVWGGELLINGVVVREKRARGRPRKSSVAA